jgi:iron complex transport system ATP-binding protein
LLRAVDLEFGYGAAPVLRGVDVAIARGSLVGLLGPNGSGKTTLLRLLAGVLTPAHGRVELDGVNLHSVPRRRLARRIAVVPQDTHLTFDFKVLEVALMGRHPYLGPFELEGPDDVAAARRALEATGTLALADRSFDTLSGGERQRVVIASALTQFEEIGGAVAGQGDASARVLLLDEPTASLDIHYQLEIGALLRRLNRERQLTTVISTHDLNFAAGVCDEIILLRDGHVLSTGPTSDVLTPAAVRALYGIDADVRFHEVAGHLTIVPIAGTGGGPGAAGSPRAPAPR